MHYAKEVRSETIASTAWSPMSWLFSALAPADVTRLVTSDNTPVSSIENMMRGFVHSANPWSNAYVQASMEMVSLATRRSQALMTLPIQAVQCKSQMDMIDLQFKYGQVAVQQYTESARRVASAWSVVTPVAAQLSRTLDTVKSEQVPVAIRRDRIVIEDPAADQAGEPARPNAPADVPGASVSKPRSADRKTAA